MKSKNTKKNNKNNIGNSTSDIDINDVIERIKNPKSTISNEELSELKRNISESISIDRQRLIVKQPFTGGMLMHFEIIPIRDYRLGTAMTDGSRIFFDLDFYIGLNDDERLFVLAHECWHCIYLHFLRKQNRNSKLWNVASDCEINYMLDSQGFVKPDNLCFPEKEDGGKSAEEIYEKLLKKIKKQNGSSVSKKSSSQSSSKSIGNGNCGTKDNKGKLSGQFDKHVSDEDSEVDKKGFKLPTDKWGEKGEDPDYHPRVNCDVAEKIRESVISEAQKYERQKGTLPGGLESILEKFRKPEISWREILCQEVTKCYSDRREWLPPNRRYVYQGLYMQSRHGEKVRVTVIVDTSGSTTADLPKFMGELVGLLNSFSNYEMQLIQCDAEIQSVEKYDDCNPFPLEDCSKIKFKGFGGSNLNPAFEYIENNNDIDGCQNMIVVFTDGYIDVPENPPTSSNVLWVLTSDGNDNLCNYGKKIRFKDTIKNTDND